MISDDVGTITGNIANNNWVTNDNTPTLSGTGEPGSLVNLYDNGLLMTVMLIDKSGTWSYTVPDNKQLADRDHHFTVSATDAAGNVVTSPSLSPLPLTPSLLGLRSFQPPQMTSAMHPLTCLLVAVQTITCRH